MTAVDYRQARDVCVKHAEHLSQAMAALSSHRPWCAADMAALDRQERAFCDQFVLRFSKLQDAMGTQLMPAVLDLAQEPGELTAFIDKLNRLEKIGAIPSADAWLKTREMRNQFAHDYPDDPELQASLFNKAFDLADKMLVLLAALDQFSARLV
ncbi:MAG: hypothetical protein CVV18_02200 [Gammaproteobacteria bacterium HGW-Gammaproteobacteria-8]|nr:MAG: hypothetical protein CVV18_02200 [Gammaproteobacteria bacterium HGW-Gammaproteobacteria-8]